MITYYKTPFVFHKSLAGKDLETCSLTDSISKNIELIVMTKHGEHRADATFGCAIWDIDFELMASKNIWEERLRQSLMAAIDKHEPRLTNIVLNIVIDDLMKQFAFDQYPEIKKSVSVQLRATIKKNGTDFLFNTNLYLSPLSKN